MKEIWGFILMLLIMAVLFSGCTEHFSEEENQMLIKETTMRVIEGAKTDVEKAEKIFYFIRDEIKFGWVFPQEIPAADVLRNGKGVCMQKANLQVAMMREAGLKARFHFMYVSKKALEDFLPGFAYNNWPDSFAHTFPEVLLNEKWVSVEATFDKELHDICQRKQLNFAKEQTIVDQCSMTFSAEGIKGHQQYNEIKGTESFYGDSLSEFTEYLHAEVPWWKRLMQPLIFRKADKIMTQYRNF